MACESLRKDPDFDTCTKACFSTFVQYRPRTVFHCNRISYFISFPFFLSYFLSQIPCRSMEHGYLPWFTAIFRGTRLSSMVHDSLFMSNHEPNLFHHPFCFMRHLARVLLYQRKKTARPRSYQIVLRHTI